jgi:hypothetical protein
LIVQTIIKKKGRVRFIAYTPLLLSLCPFPIECIIARYEERKGIRARE